MMIKIDAAELLIYFKNGNTISEELSPTQLKAILQVLGYEFKSESYSCFPDQFLVEKIIPSLPTWRAAKDEDSKLKH